MPDSPKQHESATPPRSATAGGLVGLLASVPAPTIGALAAMVFLPGTLPGQSIYTLSKLWLGAFPLFWRLRIEREPISWSPLRERSGWIVGVVSGLLISAVIVIAWFVARASNLIDPATIREAAIENGIGTPLRYVAFSFYIICINSLLEEYFWRWFVVRRCEDLVRRGWMAAVLSAFLFTLHHIIALKVQMDWLPTILASVGILFGGVIWSAMYVRYRSIWPAYLSHAIVDLAFLIIGYFIIVTPPAATAAASAVGVVG